MGGTVGLTMFFQEGLKEPPVPLYLDLLYSDFYVAYFN